MRQFLQESNLKIKRIALVHGKEDQTLVLVENLKTVGFP